MNIDEQKRRDLTRDDLLLLLKEAAEVVDDLNDALDNPTPSNMARRLTKMRNRMLHRFYKCDGCDHYHPFGWTGDCRNDEIRFAGEELDEKYGMQDEGWIEVDEETGEPI